MAGEPTAARHPLACPDPPSSGPSASTLLPKRGAVAFTVSKKRTSITLPNGTAFPHWAASSVSSHELHPLLDAPCGAQRLSRPHASQGRDELPAVPGTGAPGPGSPRGGREVPTGLSAASQGDRPRWTRLGGLRGGAGLWGGEDRRGWGRSGLVVPAGSGTHAHPTHGTAPHLRSVFSLCICSLFPGGRLGAISRVPFPGPLTASGPFSAARR